MHKKFFFENYVAKILDYREKKIHLLNCGKTYDFRRSILVCTKQCKANFFAVLLVEMQRSPCEIYRSS